MDPDSFAPDVVAIAKALAQSPVYVDPSLTGHITSKQLSAITTNIEASTTPVRVIVVPLTRENDLSPIQLITLVHRQLPEDGIWYVAVESYAGRWNLESTTYGVSVENANNLAAYVGQELYPTDLPLQLTKVTELIAEGTARTAYEQTFPESLSGRTALQSNEDPFLGVGWPAVGTGLGVLAFVVAIASLRRRRIAGRGEIVVKERALRRIGAAQTDAWRNRAQEASERLGERINAQQISADSHREAWTAALDHYEAASRVLDRNRSAADLIGALVLAERGHDALDHAIAGHAWTPSPACFFNPLHGPATTRVQWNTAAGSRNVPCCRDCRRLVGKKKEPDFLDLPVGDTVVHYVDADDSAEPWASTGYGALDPDLIGRLGR